MKKKLITLLTAVLVLGGLVGVLYINKNNGGQPETGEEATEETTQAVSYMNTGAFTLCDKGEESLKNFTIKSGDNSLSLTFDKNGYVAEGYEGVALNPANVAGVASNFVGLYSDNKIDDTDRAKYGLESPQAVGNAAYEDGSEVTLTLGDLTADGKYYYMESSEAEGIYMVDAIVGGRLLYTINDLVDTTIATIKPDYVNYLQVIEKDGRELLVTFDAKASEANANLASQGLATLKMEKPLEGAIVYPYNLSGSILKTTGSITLKAIADINPSDLTAYGLNDPQAIIRLRDNEGGLEIKVGNVADDTSTYVMVNGKKSVFTMDTALLEPFRTYVITDFVEKFVSLKMRKDVLSVDITGEQGNMTLDFKADDDHKLVKDEKGLVKDNRIIIINGKEVSGEGFTDFYELLAGLSYEQIADHTPKSGEPAAKLVYTMVSGDVEEINFYSYNDNFYNVGMEGQYDMLVSKQSLKQIVDKANTFAKEG